MAAWPNGKASDYEVASKAIEYTSGDRGFEPHRGHFFAVSLGVLPLPASRASTLLDCSSTERERCLRAVEISLRRVLVKLSKIYKAVDRGEDNPMRYPPVIAVVERGRWEEDVRSQAWQPRFALVPEIAIARPMQIPDRNNESRIVSCLVDICWGYKQPEDRNAVETDRS